MFSFPVNLIFVVLLQTFTRHQVSPFSEKKNGKGDIKREEKRPEEVVW